MTFDVLPLLRDDLINNPDKNQALLSGYAADEIDLLRRVGDALVAAIRNHNLTEADIKGWEDARRI